MDAAVAKMRFTMFGSAEIIPSGQMGSRVLGIDIGRRRVGLAISDATRTLATPLRTIAVTERDIADRMVAEIASLSAEDDGLSAIVIGVPVRLDGSANDETAWVRTVIDVLK